MRRILTFSLLLIVSVLLLTGCSVASHAVTSVEGNEAYTTQTTITTPATTIPITQTQLASNTGPAAFSLSALTIEPRDIATGSLFSISVIVSNTGSSQGTYDAVLYFDEVTISLTATLVVPSESTAKSVVVAAGGSQEVVFDSLSLNEGLYTVAIGELKDYIEVGC